MGRLAVWDRAGRAGLRQDASGATVGGPRVDRAVHPREPGTLRAPRDGRHIVHDLGGVEPASRRRDRGMVADLGLDGDDVGQDGSSGRGIRTTMSDLAFLMASTLIYDVNAGGIKG